MELIIDVWEGIDGVDMLSDMMEHGIVKVAEGGLVRMTQTVAAKSAPRALAAHAAAAPGGLLLPGTVVGMVDPVALARGYEARASKPTGAGKLLAAGVVAAKVALPLLASNPATALPALVLFGGLAAADAARRAANAREGRLHAHIGAQAAALAARVDALQASVTAGFSQLATAVAGVHEDVKGLRADLGASFVAEAEAALKLAHGSQLKKSPTAAAHALENAVQSLALSRSKLPIVFRSADATPGGRAGLARLFALSLYAEVAAQVRLGEFAAAQLALDGDLPAAVDLLGAAHEGLPTRDGGGDEAVAALLRATAALLLDQPAQVALLERLAAAQAAAEEGDDSSGDGGEGAAAAPALSPAPAPGVPVWLLPPGVVVEERDVPVGGDTAVYVAVGKMLSRVVGTARTAAADALAAPVLEQCPRLGEGYLLRAEAALGSVPPDAAAALADVDTAVSLGGGALDGAIVTLRLRALTAAAAVGTPAASGGDAAAAEPPGASTSAAVLRRHRYLAALLGERPASGSGSGGGAAATAALPGAAVASGATRLISASEDHDIKVWAAAPGGDGKFTCSATLMGSTGRLMSLVLLPDGRLASGSRDKTIKLWSLDGGGGGKCVATLAGHTDTVKALAVLPDGRLASGSWDKTIKVWTLDRSGGGKCVATLEAHTGHMWALAVLPDGRLASGSGDKTIKVWALGGVGAGGTCVITLEGHAGDVNALAVLPDGRLASGSDDKTIKLWLVGGGRGLCVATLEGHTEYVYAFAVLPDGRLASGSNDKTIKLWTLGSRGSGKCTATLEGHTDAVWALAVLPDGRLASGSDDATIKLWTLGGAGGTCATTLRGHADAIRGFVVLPGMSRTAAAASASRAVVPAAVADSGTRRPTRLVSVRVRPLLAGAPLAGAPLARLARGAPGGAAGAAAAPSLAPAQTAPPAAPTPPPPPRRSPWRQYVDPASGDAYFHNEATGETTWDAPPGWKASA
jgi:hypothetical protein